MNPFPFLVRYIYRIHLNIVFFEQNAKLLRENGNFELVNVFGSSPEFTETNVAERLSAVVEICFFLPFLLSPKKRLSAAVLQSSFVAKIAGLNAGNIYLL